MLRPSGPGAPRFCATSPNARIRFSSLATSSIVIAGRVSPGVVLDFGTAYRAEGRVGPSLSRERPLAGCRLSRETGPVGLLVHWPWSPSLPARDEQLGPSFDGLPVLRDHPTPLVSSPSRRWFLDGYRLSAEAERSPRVRTQNFVPTPSPIRPPARRIWASLPLASSPAGVDASAALRFRSVRYCIIRLLPDAPSRDLHLANALVSLMVGFLRQDPKRT